MARLILKFDSEVLREVPLGNRPVTIGRAPDNDLAIDNLSVSNYHARVSNDGGRLVVEDLNSLNGTFVNDMRVERVTLRNGDHIMVGKHVIDIDSLHDAALPVNGWRKAPAPRVNDTMVLDTKERRALLEQTAAAGERSQLAPARLRVATLTVMAGKTDRTEYPLSGKLTVIGGSKLATVRLKGWFAPSVAAQINKREDGYFLGMADRTPKVNGQFISTTTRLHEGDIIELGRIRLRFTYRD